MPRRLAHVDGGGFTLIELVITMVIAGVLVAVALPGFGALTARAKAVGAKQGIHTLLLKAHAGVKSGEINEAQLLTEPLPGMEAGSTMADASDGRFRYSGALLDGGLFVVEAEPLDDQALLGKTLLGCIQLDAGTIVMQSNFDAPFTGCGSPG